MGDDSCEYMGPLGISLINSHSQTLIHSQVSPSDHNLSDSFPDFGFRDMGDDSCEYMGPLGYYSGEKMTILDAFDDQDAMLSTSSSCESSEYDFDDDEDRIVKAVEEVRLALKGVEYYYKKHRQNYELVNALNSNYFLDDFMWYHINFTAKKPGDYQECLFFAELRRSNRDWTQVTCSSCRMLKGIRATHGCNECKKVFHPPTDCFRRGYAEYGDPAYIRVSPFPNSLV